MSWSLEATPALWTLTHDPAVVQGGALGGLVWWEAELVNEFGESRRMRFTADGEAQALLTAKCWCDWSNHHGATATRAYDALHQSEAAAAFLEDSCSDVPAFLRRQAD